jgi:hypothetical protein
MLEITYNMERGRAQILFLVAVVLFQSSPCPLAGLSYNPNHSDRLRCKKCGRGA